MPEGGGGSKNMRQAVEIADCSRCFSDDVPYRKMTTTYLFLFNIADNTVEENTHPLRLLRIEVLS